MKTLEKKTVVDYEALPEGSPYQLVEGGLIMSPAPAPDHQVVSGNIYLLLRMAVSCLLYTSPSPRDRTRSRMPSSA